jgi:hypothetical protein
MPRPWNGAVLLGDAVRDRRPLWAACRGCGRRVRLDPAVVAQRTGYDMPVPALATKLRCLRCGNRQAEVRLGGLPNGAKR